MNSLSSSSDNSGAPFVALAVVVGVINAGLYVGLQTSVLIAGGPLLRNVTFDEWSLFVRRLPENVSDPVRAFPRTIPSTWPVVFWVSAALMWLLVVVVMVFLFRVFRSSNVGQDRKAQFGAPAWSREATRRDLAPLVVCEPTPGRTIFGVSRGRLVATEDRSQTTRTARRSKRQSQRFERSGDRGGVLVVGPARSGKTVIAIGAILEHDWGPLIASSVKTDLLAATILRRKTLGDVAVFDPLNTSGGQGNVGWTPLSGCRSADGAQSVAAGLVSAAPIDGSVRNADFWSTHAQRLAWVHLYAANLGGMSMRDVVLWTSQGHQPSKAPTVSTTLTGSSLIAQILSNALNDPIHVRDAELALAVISGIWGEADETRSGIYASAQTLFAPWEDTRIATNSELTDTVDLDWLYGGTGRRSLYICMPEHPKDALRFAVVFGGLIGALTDQAYAKRNRTNQQLPNLLLVLDEAGNTAASWLPDLSTTCASVGITLMSFWQSLAQIQHRYGDRTNTLITNHLTKIFFGGISDPMSGDTASKLSGSQEVLSRSSTTSDNSNNGGRRSLTENTTATGLIGADLVRQIRPGDALCIHGTLQPIHLRTRRYWEDRALRRRAEGVLDRRLADELERARVNASPASAPVAIGTAATTLPAASLPSQDTNRTTHHDDQAESEDNHEPDQLVSAHNNEPQDADEHPPNESN